MTSLLVDEIVTLAEGNPGAITVFSEILRRAPEVLTKEFKEKAMKKKLTGSKLWVYYKNSGYNVQRLINEITE